MMHKILNKYVYSEDDEIGRGAYGIVFKGLDCVTKQCVAIKLLNADDMQDQDSICKFQNEMSIIKEFQSPNIIKFIDCYSDNKQNIAVFDYCDGGDLLKFLEINQNSVDEETALRILIQIVNAFREIIAKGYIHRDVKPANILIKNGIFMMADFGFALKATTYEYFQQPVGTPLYMAPQLLDNVPYTSKCDIWSIGIIAYQLVYGKQPWPYGDYKSYLKNIKCYPLRFPVEKTVSDQYKNFIRQCLKIDERQRLNWAELFEHPYFDSRAQKQNIKNIQDQNGFENYILEHIQFMIKIRKLNFEEQFKLFDVNLEGNLSQNQFYIFIQRVDPSLTDQELFSIYTQLNVENKQKLSQNQFKLLFNINDTNVFKDIYKKFIQEFQDLISTNKLKIENIFNFYDTKKVGRLGFEEFSKLIQRVKPTLLKYEIALIFAKFDLNNVNSISLEDFKSIVSPEQKIVDKITLKKIQQDIKQYLRKNNLTNECIFKKYNKSRSNKLNLLEFRIFCKEFNNLLSTDEIKQLFKQVDKNNDKVLSYEEFNNFFN
ncbi:unnamed protein product (macronuclear) [Paramecium tetraurelia]|uniref:Uncharacterized protein n=1 Tax=Paramecium tetraurelia TaxID=5888 RepID=A0BND2_PARTE|nr:uncharacterized protein GSPATT00030687001 [Paramecium tetraurelia]CAK60049.1 unnamed protein product [Paramecium tetraurelia]|eukprot:XP_001427447.1 hypothetical protein (macronuclear) [Paramecium tetraurelia strain d4-2]